MISYIQELSKKLKDTEKAMSMELEKLHQVTIHYTILAAVQSPNYIGRSLTTYTYLLNNFSGTERETSRERTWNRERIRKKRFVKTTLTKY